MIGREVSKMRTSLRRILYLLIASAAVGCCGLAQMATDIPPHGKLVRLFNGKDLTGFDILLQSKGLNNDTDKIFQVEKGIIHVSGDDFGGIVTQKEYENYYLRAQFKWGEKTWQDRVGKARDCGILYNITGPLPLRRKEYGRALSSSRLLRAVRVTSGWSKAPASRSKVN